MRAHLILNHSAGTLDAAGSETRTADSITAAFADAGLRVRTVAVAPDSLENTLRDVLASRPDAVFAGGGDGTIATAAAHLVGTSIPLGILPLGTLNHFAKDLRLPDDWRDAIPVLARGNVRAVDV